MPRHQRNTATPWDVPPPSNMRASLTRTNSKTSEGDRTATRTARGVTRPVDPRLLALCVKYECILTAQEEDHARELWGQCGDCHARSPVTNRFHRYDGRLYEQFSRSDTNRTTLKARRAWGSLEQSMLEHNRVIFSGVSRDPIVSKKRSVSGRCCRTSGRRISPWASSASGSYLAFLGTRSGRPRAPGCLAARPALPSVG